MDYFEVREKLEKQEENKEKFELDRMIEEIEEQAIEIYLKGARSF